MRRITLWITATCAALLLLVAYQANASGTTGKDGEDGPHPAPTVTSTTTDHLDKPGESK